jgi:hypothetical protein
MCCSACRRRYRRFMTSFEAKSDQCHVTSVQGRVTWVYVAFSRNIAYLARPNTYMSGLRGMYMGCGACRRRYCHFMTSLEGKSANVV